MSKRLNQCFQKLADAKRKAFIPYIMAGDPNVEMAQAILEALPDAGADIIELGMPFTDPMADGKTIQAAGLRALAHPMSVEIILTMVRRFRQSHPDVPIILMGYANPVVQYGIERFCNEAHKAGVDGLLIVDVPYEQEALFTEHTSAVDIAWIRLIAPTTKGKRLKTLVAQAEGFIYCISVAGVTGEKAISEQDIATYIREARAHTSLPVVAGFGIRTSEHARQIGGIADGIVVGSGLIDIIQQAIGQENCPVQAATEYVSQLSATLNDR